MSEPYATNCKRGGEGRRIRRRNIALHVLMSPSPATPAALEQRIRRHFRAISHPIECRRLLPSTGTRTACAAATAASPAVLSLAASLAARRPSGRWAAVKKRRTCERSSTLLTNLASECGCSAALQSERERARPVHGAGVVSGSCGQPVEASHSANRCTYLKQHLLKNDARSREEEAHAWRQHQRGRTRFGGQQAHTAGADDGRCRACPGRQLGLRIL